MIKRALLVIVLVFVFCMTLLFSRFYFDAADGSDARTLVLSQELFQSPSHTVIAEMARIFKVDPDSILCLSDVQSRYEGKVVVRCAPEGVDLSTEDVFAWQVYLLDKKIEPLNEKTKALFSTQTSPLPPQSKSK